MMEFIPAYNSQFIKGKLSDIQKLLRSLSGIATSTFKDSTGNTVLVCLPFLDFQTVEVVLVFVLFINVLLIFDMHDLNGVLFLNAKSFLSHDMLL